MTMAKNVLPFRKPVPVAAQSTAREHSRVIFQIGGSRFALNFHVTVTEVNPVDAEILSIDKGLLGPQRARRKVSSTQFERRSFQSEKSWCEAMAWRLQKVGSLRSAFLASPLVHGLPASSRRTYAQQR